MRNLSLVFAYYDNPGMLERQFAAWCRYPDFFKRRVEAIVVDDASPRWPALDVPRPEGLLPLSIYRAAEDIPWHQDAARNLGAFVAADGWLFLSDMDHVLTAENLAVLWRAASSTETFYTFDRMDVATGQPMVDGAGNHKPHPNTYAMHRDLYWKAGGYDEDYCGVYGTDGAFRKQLMKAGKHKHLAAVKVWRVSREVVADASTTTLDRKAYGGTAAKRAALQRKADAGRIGKITTLNFEWERVL